MTGNSSLATLLLVLLSCVTLAAPDAQAEERAWIKTLERISTGVVSIRVDSTRAFDTDWNQSSQATGFVVDAERGILLTNRHVVTPGPVVAEAVFLDNEEVRLTPIYRDPVHDFGFYRYNPDDLQYIEPAELPLVPGAAQIGREIRVVGNDAGEQLSILAGTIARLDRRAPQYGRGKYNDFNTFYFQAASGTSGGSSGSPVINIEGQVVALNAGANSSAASSFFLPLDRVYRVLQLLQSGAEVSRGTLETVFVRKTYDELRRLGLTPATEKTLRGRNSKLTGMLVVQQIIRGSSADQNLAPGDILVAIDGEFITEFVPLEAYLDDHVGKTVNVDIERGGVAMSFAVVVSDLHAISPSEYIEFGDGVVHKLSYQQARHYNRPIAGVYVANPGYLFSKSAIPRGAVITEFDGKPVDDLKDFEIILAGLADGERVPIRYVTLDDPRNEVFRLLPIDRTWFPSRHCIRDDRSGTWPCTDLQNGLPAKVAASGSTRFPKSKDPIVRALAPSLVVVNFDLPYMVSGVADRHYYGTGVILDVEKGLVVVDRNTVPVAMGDVKVTFAGSLEVPGKVEFIHPLHNLAIVSYDPAQIGDTPVRAAKLDDRKLTVGDKLWVVGRKSDHRLVHQATSVASVDPVIFPLSRTLRFRDSNLESVSLVNAPGEVDGVLADKRGQVVSLWSSFSYQGGNDSGQINSGVPADLVSELLDVVRSGGHIHSLEVEFGYLPLFAARKLGLSEEWLAKLEAHNPQRRQTLNVIRTVAGSPAAKLLRTGDVVLAIDGNIVTTFRELERAVQKADVEVTIWRDDAQQVLPMATVSLDGIGIDRALSWAGALLQDPHRAMAAQRGIESDGVYVAFFNYGSPATRYGLFAGRRIVAVDGIATPNLQAFIDAVAGKPDRSSVRLKTVSWNEAVEVITLKLDKQYWPAYEIRRTEEGWQRFPVG